MGGGELGALRHQAPHSRLSPDPQGRAQLRAESGSWQQFVDAVGKVLEANEQPV